MPERRNPKLMRPPRKATPLRRLGFGGSCQVIRDIDESNAELFLKVFPGTDSFNSAPSIDISMSGDEDDPVEIDVGTDVESVEVPKRYADDHDEKHATHFALQGMDREVVLAFGRRALDFDDIRENDPGEVVYHTKVHIPPKTWEELVSAVKQSEHSMRTP